MKGVANKPSTKGAAYASSKKLLVSTPLKELLHNLVLVPKMYNFANYVNVISIPSFMMELQPISN